MTRFCVLKLFLQLLITIYLKQVVRTNGIPFPVTAEMPNALTLKAIEEAEKGKMASFSSIDALMEDLND